MNIQIKNLKFSEFASQETHCFEATVYIDGSRSFIASNSGHGGCNDYHPILNNKKEPCPVSRAMIQKVEDYLATQPEEATGIKNTDGTEFMMRPNLDSVICDLVNDALIRKDLKSLLRKVAIVTAAGEIATYPAKVKPTVENLAYVMRQNNVLIVLNAMPFDCALEVYKEAG